VHCFGVAGGDIAVAHRPADNRSVFALYQGIVLLAARARARELDQELLEQFRDPVINEFGAVIGM